MSWPAAEPSEPKKTILVVEDEVLIRMVIADYLRDLGYQVVEAGSADEALGYLQTSNQVGLVFSDVRMPGSMDGVELVRRLRTLHPDIPVVLASGHLPESEADDAPLLSKPYKLSEVAKTIEALLGESNRGAARHVED